MEQDEMGHRENVRREIIEYTDNNPDCTFQEMVDAWVKQGKNLHSGILWEFVMEQGLANRFR